MGDEKSEDKTEEKQEVEITEQATEAVDTRSTRKELEEEGILEDEIKMHEEQGLIKPEENADDKKEAKSKEEKTDESKDKKSDDKEEKKEEKKEDKDTKENKYENTTEDELTGQILDGKEPTIEELDKYKSFTPNVRRLYRQQKRYQERAQSSELAQAKLNATIKKLKETSGTTDGRIAALTELMAGDADEITQDAIQEILKSDVKSDKKDPNKPITQKDLDDKATKDKADKDEADDKAKEIASNLKIQYDEGKDRFGEDEFNTAMDLADEVVKNDKTNVYAQRLMDAASNPNPEPGQGAADVAMAIAKLHPDFGKPVEKTEKKDEKEPSKEEKNKVEKIIKNAEKNPSSAAVGGGAKKIVSYDDLTPDDVINLTPEQWKNIPDNVRERLLQEA